MHLLCTTQLFSLFSVWWPWRQLSFSSCLGTESISVSVEVIMRFSTKPVSENIKHQWDVKCCFTESDFECTLNYVIFFFFTCEDRNHRHTWMRRWLCLMVNKKSVWSVFLCMGELISMLLTLKITTRKEGGVKNKQLFYYFLLQIAQWWQDDRNIQHLN